MDVRTKFKGAAAIAVLALGIAEIQNPQKTNHAIDVMASGLGRGTHTILVAGGHLAYGAAHGLYVFGDKTINGGP